MSVQILSNSCQKISCSLSTLYLQVRLGIACGSREGRQQQGHSHREPAPTEVGRKHLRPEQLAGSAGGETAANGAKGANDAEATQSAKGPKDATVPEVAKGGRDAMRTKGLKI